MRSVISFLALFGLLAPRQGFCFNVGPRKQLCSFLDAAVGKRLAMTASPSLDELSNDPFMKQVSHAEALVAALSETSESKKEDLEEMLVTQLSHSDGIRGFFVTYLTGETSPADNPTVPEPLQNAMAKVDAEELVSLACMNVVMPTGMISMHEDPSLSLQSKKTSERGVRILVSLLQGGDPTVLENCQAILHVADGSVEEQSDAKLVKYWTEFFKKWGYKEPQRKDIATAMRAILQQQQ